jgi:hypothetical protein
MSSFRPSGTVAADSRNRSSSLLLHETQDPLQEEDQDAVNGCLERPRSPEKRQDRCGVSRNLSLKPTTDRHLSKRYFTIGSMPPREHQARCHGAIGLSFQRKAGRILYRRRLLADDEKHVAVSFSWIFALRAADAAHSRIEEESIGTEHERLTTSA